MLEFKVLDGSDEVVLHFEHSLLSLSKWEEQHKKPFLSTQQKTPVELIDYFQCMLLTPDVDPNLVFALAPDQLERLSDYLNETRSASKIPESSGGKAKAGPQEVVTSELVYYWMSALKIPFHPAETWHFSRLMMLVRIADFKQQPEKKRNPQEALADWREMNERNRARFNSNG